MRVEAEAASPYPERYRSIAQIGRGGMAEILLAAMEANGVTKLAVLKCLWPELSAESDLVEMFLDEARLCTRLAHPNVVQTYEVLYHDGRLAMAMEYLDGQPLTAVLNRLGGAAALTLPLRLAIISNILAGLHHAHELCDYGGRPLAIVHRDVTPHNVFITYDGHVKLVDFGVAKCASSRHLTRPGTLKGKLAYMAPEILRGESVDRRADIFSVGVMMWEMLAGRRLWDRASESSIAWRLSTGLTLPAIPPEQNVPPEVEDVCMRALASDPEARYQTAAEVEDALARAGVAAAGDASGRQLGRLVSTAFDAERGKRRSLIEANLLQEDSNLPDPPPVFVAEAFERSFTIVEERPAPPPPPPPRQAPPPHQAFPTPQAPPPYLALSMPQAPPVSQRRPPREASPLLRSAGIAFAAVLALGVAGTVGRNARVSWGEERPGGASPVSSAADDEAVSTELKRELPTPRSIATAEVESDANARLFAPPTPAAIEPPRRERASYNEVRRDGRRDGTSESRRRARGASEASDEVLDPEGRPAVSPGPASTARVLDSTDPFQP